MTTNSDLFRDSFVYSISEIPVPEQKTLADLMVNTMDLELKKEIITEISKYDWPINTAIAVAKCESGLNPRAYNPETKAKERGITIYSSYGVFQLNRQYDERYYDYQYNILEAYKLYQKRGFNPWTCFTKTY